ncbi:transport protein particle component [Rhodocollybia butyracea]|uniref:Transport protein particle component n=1 Tax=Rhodocollybia butyracea TaxID=206335 RepID=A0A9P5PSH8_9AGAR|nr:transport protein particle component [Rhodocollybia butyracea]
MSGRSSLQIPSSTSSSSIPAHLTPLAALTDPPIRHVDSAMMDYFLIEVVNTLRESSKVALNREREREKEMVEAGLIPPLALPAKDNKDGTISARDSTGSLASTKGGKTAAAGPIDEEEEALKLRLEAIGMHVGSNFSERLCRDRALFTETLDAIKFICKDIWVACWDKQVDNLRTNHRGVYVLQDNSFKTISRLSSWQGRPDAVRKAKVYVSMPAGIIKGALSRLGYNATVSPEVTTLPQCTFQVKLPKGS